MALLLLLPLASIATEGSAELASLTVADFPLLIIGVGVLTAGLVVSVFLFQNRSRQIGAIQLLMVLSVALMAWIAIVLVQEKNAVTELQVFAFKVGAVLPFLSLVLQFMALSKVRRDHRLVRSMDRLR